MTTEPSHGWLDTLMDELPDAYSEPEKTAYSGVSDYLRIQGCTARSSLRSIMRRRCSSSTGGVKIGSVVRGPTTHMRLAPPPSRTAALPMGKFYRPFTRQCAAPNSAQSAKYVGKYLRGRDAPSSATAWRSNSQGPLDEALPAPRTSHQEPHP